MPQFTSFTAYFTGEPTSPTTDNYVEEIRETLLSIVQEVNEELRTTSTTNGRLKRVQVPPQSNRIPTAWHSRILNSANRRWKRAIDNSVRRGDLQLFSDTILSTEMADLSTYKIPLPLHTLETTVEENTVTISLPTDECLTFEIDTFETKVTINGMSNTHTTFHKLLTNEYIDEYKIVWLYINPDNTVSIQLNGSIETQHIPNAFPDSTPSLQRMCPITPEKVSTILEDEGKGEAVEFVTQNLLGENPNESGTIARAILLCSGVKPAGLFVDFNEGWWDIVELLLDAFSISYIVRSDSRDGVREIIAGLPSRISRYAGESPRGELEEEKRLGYLLGYSAESVAYYITNKQENTMPTDEKALELQLNGDVSETDLKYYLMVEETPAQTTTNIWQTINKGKRYEDALHHFDKQYNTTAGKQTATYLKDMSVTEPDLFTYV